MRIALPLSRSRRHYVVPPYQFFQTAVGFIVFLANLSSKHKAKLTLLNLADRPVINSNFFLSHEKKSILLYQVLENTIPKYIIPNIENLISP